LKGVEKRCDGAGLDLCIVLDGARLRRTLEIFRLGSGKELSQKN